MIDLRNTKVDTDGWTKDERIKLQDLAKSQGFDWRSKTYINGERYYGFMDKDHQHRMFYYSSSKAWNENFYKLKTITKEDIFPTNYFRKSRKQLSL